MLEVTITADGHAPQMVRVEQLPCGIGKSRDNAVVLPGWRVGRQHALLKPLAVGVAVVDLGTIGGTWVNGNRVVEYGPLLPTDEIIIGNFAIAVASAGSVPSVAPPSPRASSIHAAATALPADIVESVQPPPSRSGSGGDNGKRSLASPPADAVRPAAEAPDAAVEPVAPRHPATRSAAFEWRKRVHMKLLETIDLRRKDVRQLSDQQLRIEVAQMIDEILRTELTVPAPIDRAQLVREVIDEALGYGPLEDLMADPAVTEIMVNRSDEIYVERQGRLEKVDVSFTGDDAVRTVIDRIVAPLGRRIDEAMPMVDARLPDGSRVNAIIPPLAIRGPAITIRRFNKATFTPQRLLELGSASQRMIDFLQLCVLQRRSVVVSGGTGSGKTSLLNVLSNFIPRHERIITIEDAAELQLQHPHLVSLEARPPNVEGKGAIMIRDLVRNSLRMRPDRIIVGECRGGEAIDMLQAMNTGHEGSLTTVHANSPRDALARLEVMALSAGIDLPLNAVREQIAAAVDIIVQQARAADGSRRITQIVEVSGIESGRIQTADIFRYRVRGTTAEGRQVGAFEACDVVPSFIESLRAAGIEVDLDMFRRAGEAAL